MENALYRKNVFKTLSIKPAKDGVKYAARNTARINLLHAGTGFATEVMEFTVGLSSYILDGRLTKEAKDNAFEELGDIGYYLMVLAKTLKIKPPTSKRKLKLIGTPSRAILDLLSKAEEVLSLQKKVYYGVKLKEVKAVDGKTLIRVDAEAQKAVDAKRAEDMKKPVAEAYELYFKIVYSLFGVTPSAIYAGNIAKLAHRYPDGFFTTVSANAVKDTPKEVAVAKEAAAKSTKKVAKPKTQLKAVA